MSKAASSTDRIELPAHPTQSPAVLNRVREVLARAHLPTTATVLDASATIGLARLKSVLATLEASGEITLNRRGDTVFAITEPAPYRSRASPWLPIPVTMEN